MMTKLMKLVYYRKLIAIAWAFIYTNDFQVSTMQT